MNQNCIMYQDGNVNWYLGPIGPIILFKGTEKCFHIVSKTAYENAMVRDKQSWKSMERRGKERLRLQLVSQFNLLLLEPSWTTSLIYSWCWNLIGSLTWTVGDITPSEERHQGLIYDFWVLFLCNGKDHLLKEWFSSH